MPNCKVGDICVVKGSTVPANNGLIVEVVRALAPLETLEGRVFLDGKPGLPSMVSDGSKHWVIETVSAKITHLVLVGAGRQIGTTYSDLGVFADYKLFPLRGNPDEVNTQVWANDYHLRAEA